MSHITQPWGIRYLFRIALGVVMLWAALAKIGDPGSFAVDIHNYRLLPVALENIFALALIWTELLVGLALITNLAPRSGTLLSGAFLVMFFIAILQAVIRNLDIDCGCFGTSDGTSAGIKALIRDTGFLALVWIGYPRDPR